MKISSQRVIAESIQLMSEAVHEAAHAVIARVLPSPLTHAREYRVRTLREIITNEEDARSYIVSDHKYSVGDIGGAYRRGDRPHIRKVIRQVYKNCIVLMAGHVADSIFLHASWSVDERFDRFWEMVSYCINEKDWRNPTYGDDDMVALYLATIVVNEYGRLDEFRLNAITRGLYHIAHGAVRRNWWCIKAVAGNSIYTDAISATSVNYLIDRLAIGCRRIPSDAMTHGTSRRIADAVKIVRRPSAGATS